MEPTAEELKKQLEQQGLELKQTQRELKLATACKGIPNARKNEKGKETPLTPEQEVELAIRKLVKRSGGYRKGINDGQKAQCQELMEAAGRKSKKPMWDNQIFIPGYSK